MSVTVRLPYLGSREKDNGREQKVLTEMEAWLVKRDIRLDPVRGNHYRPDDLPLDGSYYFDNDDHFKYLNIRLPETVALLFKLTWGVGVV